MIDEYSAMIIITVVWRLEENTTNHIKNHELCDRILLVILLILPSE